MSCSQGLAVAGLRRMLIALPLIWKSLSGRKAQFSPVLRGDRVWYPSPGAPHSLHLEIGVDTSLGNSLEMTCGCWAEAASEGVRVKRQRVISSGFEHLWATEGGDGSSSGSSSSRPERAQCAATAPAAYPVQSNFQPEAPGLHEQFSKRNWEEVCSDT